MKLVAVTYGSEGDTRPIAALCRALMDSGDEVIFLADGGTLGGARDLGVLHAALAGNFREVVESSSVLSSTVPVKNSLNATAKILTHLARENSETWMRQILEAAAGADGVIVSGLVADIGFSAAEKFGIPAVGAGMIPLTPTSAFPSPLLPPGPIPRWLNRFSYRLFDEILWLAFRKATNAARATVGLPSGRDNRSGRAILYGISPTLLPRPDDWPDNARMCGQWLCPVRE
jgi:sterol 3beta-glucosyltransferase